MLGHQKTMAILSRIQQHGDRIMPWFGVCEAHKRWNIANESAHNYIYLLLVVITNDDVVVE
jgi:hypothetical protein